MRHILVAAVLTATLAAPAPSSLLGPFWDLLASLWSATASSDAGCGADPDGRCIPAAQPTSDIGCGADPDGWCANGGS